LLAFTDDDVLVDPGWPDALVAGFQADPEAACITGLVASRSLNSAPEQYFDARYPWGEVFEARRYDLTTHRGESRLYPLTAGIFGTGANFAVRRQAVDRLGGFDPLLGAGGPGRGGEDLDMFLRLILAGTRICYLPAALVWHRHRADNRALAEQVYAYGHGLGAYLAKRVTRRELRPAMLWRGLAWSGVLAGRMHRASGASQLKSRGIQLALAEAWGVLAGVTRFYQAARRERNHERRR
jgi:GT2 family glycosyltransferase